jgi:hypothetical protein
VARWRGRFMRDRLRRIWWAFGLKPHLVDTWKLSSDPQFIEKVRDVVGLYLDPPAKALVLCVDEKSQMQALDRTAPMLPMMPGALLRFRAGVWVWWFYRRRCSALRLGSRAGST